VIFVVLVDLVLTNVKIDIASRPYYFRDDQHGSTKTMEQIRTMLSTYELKNTKIEYEVFRAAMDTNTTVANFELHQIAKDYANNLVNGKLIRLNNPIHHFSILEPKDGCGHHNTVQDTVVNRAFGKKCRVATNAGFFNTHTFQCYGNVVTSGKLVQNQKKHNANFGITKVIISRVFNIAERKLLHWICEC
jgi:hypothetical protein